MHEFLTPPSARNVSPIARSLTKPASSSQATVLGVVALGVVALGLVACSGNGTSDGSGGGNSGGAGNGTGTNANGTGSIANGTGGTNSAGTFSNGSGTSSMNGGVGGGCATTTQQAQKIPLDMYIMLDQSGSMDSTVGGGMTRWTAVTGALTTFLQQQQAGANLGVGIQFFSLGATTADDSCVAADYANPLSTDGNGLKGVEIAPLPGNTAALVASIAAHAPYSLTPTSAALQGAVDHAKAWQIANPNHVVVAVLATDGQPSWCDTNLNNINAIAAAGLASPQKIKTFVIGVGSATTNLDGIAAAGGTGQAFIVDTNPMASQQFLAALNAIQGTSLACNFIIPPPPMGQQPDFTALNVQYTPGNGGSPVLIPNVADAASCPANGNAWYYDNPAAPTQVILCGTTCNTVKGDTQGKIEVVLGCKTVPA